MPLSLPDLPSPVSLRRILPGASFVGCGEVIVNDATDDSRLVTEDSVFAAICGTTFDGREFAAAAVANGCSAVLTERPLPDVSVSQCVVPNVRAAYARICNAIRRQTDVSTEDRRRHRHQRKNNHSVDASINSRRFCSKMRTARNH